MDARKYFILSSIIVAISIVLSAFVVRNYVLTFNVGIWGLILIIIPTMIINYLEFNRIKKIEDQFPRFLRDLAESSRSGISLLEAFKKTSTGDYGDLSPELRRVRNAIEWNVPLEKALEKMMKRLSASKHLSKIISIIIETYKSGADSSNILFGLSRDIERLREIENDKKSMLFRHIMTIYSIFIIFLVIVVILLRSISPIITSTSSMSMNTVGFGFGVDPCKGCYYFSFDCMSCFVFKGTAAGLGFGSYTSQLTYYKGLMFWMIIIQALFSGMVAGFIESPNILSSFKHSSIMLLIGFLSFYIANAAGVI